MRICLLALASCWTGPVAPAPVVPAAPAVAVVTRLQLMPTGYFVPDLIAHRLETRAFDEVDALDAELAVFEPGPAALQRRAIPIGSKNMMRASIAVGVVEYCIDVTGRVTSAHVAVPGDVVQPPQRRAGLVEERTVLEQLRGWRFAPYFVAGKPVMACSFIDYATIAP